MCYKKENLPHYGMMNFSDEIVKENAVKTRILLYRIIGNVKLIINCAKNPQVEIAPRN